jgi:hypothetical protein
MNEQNLVSGDTLVHFSDVAFLEKIVSGEGKIILAYPCDVFPSTHY